MIEIQRTGSIFDCGANILVNPVNCIGVMGKGLALEFKNRFPVEYYEKYKKDCRDKFLRPGIVSFWVNTDEASSVKMIVNFPTKNLWYSPSKLQWIENGLKTLSFCLQFEKTPFQIALPALGCGEGGLNFDDVLPLIEQHLVVPEDSGVIVFSPQK